MYKSIQIVKFQKGSIIKIALHYFLNEKVESKKSRSTYYKFTNRLIKGSYLLNGYRTMKSTFTNIIKDCNTI